jgi:hypothetical protein
MSTGFCVEEAVNPFSFDGSTLCAELWAIEADCCKMRSKLIRRLLINLHVTALSVQHKQ